MVNEASACHPTWGQRTPHLLPRRRKGGGPGASPGKAEEEGTSEFSAPWRPSGLSTTPHPWRLPCPLSTLLLQLMPSQSVDRPGLRGHLLLLGPLKA